MTFEEIANRFEHSESGSGSDAFKTFYKEAYELMKLDPDNAGLYFVVGVAAQTYVIKYEDQAVSPQFARQAKDTVMRFNRRLLDALRQDPRERLRILGEVAVEYEWKVDAF